MFIEQTRRYCQLLKVQRYTLEQIEVVWTDNGQVPMLRVYAEYQLRITRDAIAMIFPHVLQQEHIVQQLVGKPMQCSSWADYYFDAHGKVTRYDDTPDFLMAMTPLLRDPSDLAFVTSGALIADQSILGECNEPTSTRHERTADAMEDPPQDKESRSRMELHYLLSQDEPSADGA